MKTFKLLLLAFIAISITSCGGDDDAGVTVGTIEEFNLTLSTENEIPAVPGRTETGTAVITIQDNNTLKFSITVNNLASGDALVAAHLHSGGLVSTGGIIVGLVNGTDISFNGNRATGTVEVTDAQIATIRGSDVYLNVHSTNAPSGLVRSQLDQTLVFSKNIAISPANEVPAVTGRNESGVAYIRINDNNELFYRVVVNNLDTTDAITMGHIHSGAADANGPVLVNLGVTQSILDTPQVISITGAEQLSITGTPSYVNIHSTQVPSGLLRGQMVN